MAEATTEKPKGKDKQLFLAELTTDVAPRKQFKVDEEVYDILGADHLSDDDEASLTATFARHQRLAEALAQCDDDEQAVRIAHKLGEKRDEVISTLTTVPDDMLRRWPLSLKGELFKVVNKEIEAEGGGE